MTRSGWIASVIGGAALAIGYFWLCSVAGAQGTTQEQEACANDAKRFCSHTIVGTPFAVAACFRAHLAQLTPKCRAVLKKHGIQL